LRERSAQGKEMTLMPLQNSLSFNAAKRESIISVIALTFM
jgi:hypothetical protein